MRQYNEVTGRCLEEYIDNFEHLLHYRYQQVYLNVQKTLPQQGYHAWHIEKNGHSEMFNRVLAYTIYLNDVEEAGETEFLFQKKRVKPKTGRIAIWPAGFPYVHRGNPPLKEEKYIITSWMLAMPN